MSTAEMVAGIEKGSRVVYAIGGVEYSAVAVDVPHYGYNPSVRKHSAFLNLVYLNEQGTPIKIFAAPLLGSHQDDDHIGKAADYAATHDVRFASASEEEREEIQRQHFETLKANPIEIGWRPDYGSGAITLETATIDQIWAEVDKRTAEGRLHGSSNIGSSDLVLQAPDPQQQESVVAEVPVDDHTGEMLDAGYPASTEIADKALSTEDVPGALAAEEPSDEVSTATPTLAPEPAPETDAATPTA